MDWSDGYVTGVQYTRGYYKELNPLLQSFAIALTGVTPPCVDSPFVKVELGCGYGLSLLFEAATFPHAQFFGIDFNPAHITWAKRLADEAQLGNIKFHDASFADLNGSAISLPPANFVSMHGVWTWINQDNRNIIMRYLQSGLTEAGVTMVSYNTYPGWSELRSIRELMVSKFRSTAGSAETRAQAALVFAQSIAKIDGPYFRQHSRLIKAIEDLSKLPLRYLAHEYFNDDWNLFNHHDVAASMSRGGLSFAASCVPVENFSSLCLTAEAATLLSNLSGSDYQTARDVYLNKNFRYDIYTRQPSVSRPPATADQLNNFWFIANSDKAKVADPNTISAGKISHDPQLWGSILESAKGQTTSGASLISNCASLQKFPETIAAMVHGNALQLALPPLQCEARRIASTKLNEALMRRLLRAEDTPYLSSPVTGFAHPATDIDRLFMRSIQQNHEPASYTWNALRSIGRGVTRGGKLIENTDDVYRELGTRFEVFKEKMLPQMRELGFV